MFKPYSQQTILGNATRWLLVLQLHKIDEGCRDYTKFLHLPRNKSMDFALVRKEIADETDRITGRSSKSQVSVFCRLVFSLLTLISAGL